MSAYQLQKTIFTALSSLSVPVYDDVPESATLPYVVIGDDTLVDDNTNDYAGYQATVTIHSWSAYKGRSQIKQIQDEINNLLDRQKLSIVGYNMVNCYQEYSESSLDPDGITRHGVQRYRVIFNKL